ncbi:MAG: type IV pilus secretin PilQ [Deltaproteobacteria bacterium]|nr:type IV pilus secretin PilQ [Deltaproteobacteria bacterium]
MRRIFLVFILAVTLAAPIMSIMSIRPAAAGQLEPAAAASKPAGLRKRISLECRETGLRDILRALAAEAGINLILGAEVPADNVSLNFNDITIEAALNAILASRGLGMFRDREVYRVVKAEEIIKRGEDLVTEYMYLNYSNATKVIPQLQALLSERGSLRADERTNMLMVRDLPANIKNIRGLLKVLDIPTQQVMIDARIVVAAKKAVKELGVQWGGAYRNVFGGGKKTFTVGGSAASLQMADALINLPTPAASSAVTFGISKLNSYTFNVRLSALEGKDLVKILSNPRVMVLDNHRAKIGQGKEIPYKSADVDNPDTEFKEAELSLEVTPHITQKGDITLELLIRNDSQGENTPSGEPIIDTQNIDTTLLIGNGETVVIGGIISANNIKQKDGVPVFSKIPLVGGFFKHKRDEDAYGELLVFITPTIIK